MPATFTPVSIDHFRTKFPEEIWKLQTVKNHDEIILFRPCKEMERYGFWGKNVFIIIFTGISSKSNTSRVCGGDAIRITVIKRWKNSDGRNIRTPLLPKQSRINRASAANNPLDIIDRAYAKAREIYPQIHVAIKNKQQKQKQQQ
jgi:hypothetical protein